MTTIINVRNIELTEKDIVEVATKEDLEKIKKVYFDKTTLFFNLNNEKIYLIGYEVVYFYKIKK